VIPGYHLNKTHWNAAILGGAALEEELKRQTERSCDLMEPKVRKGKNEQI
jgi:Protein of unknown function (DUF419).